MLTTQTTSNRTQNQFRKYSTEALNAIALLIASLRSLEQFLHFISTGQSPTQHFFSVLFFIYKMQNRSS